MANEPVCFGGKRCREKHSCANHIGVGENGKRCRIPVFISLVKYLRVSCKLAIRKQTNTYGVVWLNVSL